MSIFCGNSDCLDKSTYLPAEDGKFRRFEELGLRVRSFAKLEIHDRLYPRNLAEILGVKVLTLDEIDGISEEVRRVLSDSPGQWSGGATPVLPDGSRLVILNPWQSNERQAATLMEEICHILLGHKHSQIKADSVAGSDQHRSYDSDIEEEAYAVGAAALVPFRSLKCDLLNGKSIKLISKHFGVTTSLVKYRIQALRLIPTMVDNLIQRLHKTHYRTQ